MGFTKEIVDFTDLSEKQVRDKLSEYNIPLTPDEARKIQNEMLGRAPSLAELVLFSIQGSEHCSYKSSRIHLKQFVTDGPDVVLGAKEDAGVVAVATDNKGDRWCVVMSHESHNHPSQIVPYEGAATGVGGNVRDVMCMGAEVIACTDSFRFGDINSNKTKWIHEGVVAGIAGYGNPLGIPNIGGDIYYHDGYNENCLVTLVTLGIVREDDLIHSYAPKNADNYDLILVGKPTDNSGFGGASFASLELQEEKKEQNRGAVQEPNAFLERHLLKSTYALFDKLKKDGLIDRVGFKDLGAGGVACASVELAETAGYGAEVWLDRVHTGMDGLHPSVYLCSETQERFMWVSPPELTEMIIKHYNKTFDLSGVSSEARASVIGKIKNNKQYIVHSNGELIIDAPAEQVTKGFLYDRPYKDPKRTFKEPDIPCPSDLNAVLIRLLGHENIASRRAVYEAYDKQVQGRTIIEAGHADAGVIAPFNSDDYPTEIRKVGIALSTDHNPRYCQIDPYWGAVNAVAESVRNIAATGATPIALTDCLCFGNPENPEQMWEFVEAVRGISDALKPLRLKDASENSIPIIAGNVSFYNESKNGAIPASPIISCLGKIDDFSKSIGMGFKNTDSVLIMVGNRKNELGGSVYYSLFNETGANIPKPNMVDLQNQINVVYSLINKNQILACHDISEGGIAVAISEMSFANGIGGSINIESKLNNDRVLFSESGGFVIEIEKNNKDTICSIMDDEGVAWSDIGRTNDSGVLHMNNVVELTINKAKLSWENGLRDKLA
tara:strand:- start:1741 stop:4080 length:2340 start_codon:yes stop_codon:yes gene_type:complete